SVHSHRIRDRRPRNGDGCVPAARRGGGGGKRQGSPQLQNIGQRVRGGDREQEDALLVVTLGQGESERRRARELAHAALARDDEQPHPPRRQRLQPPLICPRVLRWPRATRRGGFGGKPQASPQLMGFGGSPQLINR